MCLSEDKDTGKLTAVAVVSDTAQQAGLRANEWVSASLQSVGGKGGGKAHAAQGSVDALAAAIAAPRPSPNPSPISADAGSDRYDARLLNLVSQTVSEASNFYIQRFR
jgi:hypothetical protein